MFYLRVYDNYHYGDESEAYNHGKYATYEEAVAGAKAIVDEFMKWNWRENMRPNQLSVLFSIYGEDPVIIPTTPLEIKVSLPLIMPMNRLKRSVRNFKRSLTPPKILNLSITLPRIIYKMPSLFPSNKRSRQLLSYKPFSFYPVGVTP